MKNIVVYYTSVDYPECRGDDGDLYNILDQRYFSIKQDSAVNIKQFNSVKDSQTTRQDSEIEQSLNLPRNSLKYGGQFANQSHVRHPTIPELSFDTLNKPIHTKSK